MLKSQRPRSANHGTGRKWQQERGGRDLERYCGGVMIICHSCKGNGYITITHKSVEELNEKVTMNCTMCEAEGELNDPNNTIIIDADGIHRLQ